MPEKDKRREIRGVEGVIRLKKARETYQRNLFKALRKVQKAKAIVSAKF